MLKEMLGMAEGILQDLHNDHQEVSGLIDRNAATETRLGFVVNVGH